MHNATIHSREFVPSVGGLDNLFVLVAKRQDDQPGNVMGTTTDFGINEIIRKMISVSARMHENCRALCSI